MCGVCGIHDPSGVDAREVARMADTLAHRGPDGHGLVGSSATVLAHRRLAVIDLAGGAQPMTSEDGRVWLTANAEIYNHVELRAELEVLGHRFASRSDVEVILRGYEAWGIDVATRLRGMFAFAIWDARSELLLLARDRFGEKPLYYRIDGDRIAFASQPRALLELDGGARTIDAEGAALYLMLDYVPAPYSIYRGIRKLGAGERLVRDRSGARVERYWQLERRPAFRGSLRDAEAQVRASIDDAVDRQLVSDVPVGLFLSGGIDSTILAATAARSGRRLETFSIGFAEPDEYDETEHAREVSRWLGTSHHETRLEPRAVPDLMRAVAGAFDEPFADPAALPTYALSKYARERVVVALSGDGADELFSGYDVFLADRLDRATHRLEPLKRWLLPRLARRWPAGRQHFSWALRLEQLSRGLAFAPSSRGLAWMLTRTPDELAAATDGALDGGLLHTLLAGAVTDPLEAAADLLARFYLEGDILTKTDRAAMACGLEVRCPYLDLELAELVARLPASWKLHGLARKWLLKRALADRLGPARRRRKHGLRVPTGRWIEGPLRSWCDEILLDPAPYRALPIERSHVEALLRSHRAGEADRRRPLWSLLSLFLWSSRWSLPT